MRRGIQFRTLNASKGPAVRATRAQADRQLYRQAIRAAVESQPGLEVFQQEVADLRIEGGRVTCVVTATGITFAARGVLTTGTFLGGRIHVGLENLAGGRAGDPPSLRLAARLRELMPRIGRLKTGTPPRIDGRSIDRRSAAAERALKLADGAGADDLVLVLLSGGASANWIAPAEGLSLADKQAVTRALLRSGANIGEINTVRKHLSRIKGGRLARRAQPARVVTLGDLRRARRRSGGDRLGADACPIRRRSPMRAPSSRVTGSTCPTR